MYKISSPGNQVTESVAYTQTLQKHEFPANQFNKEDYDKRFKFDRRLQDQYDSMKIWKSGDLKGFQRKNYIKEIQKANEKILWVAEKGPIEKLEVYNDRFPLLKLRVALRRFVVHVHLIAHAIISSKIFDTISITIILANCAVMIADDPIKSSPFFETSENVFLVLYSIEMVLKIMGMGFIFSSKAYLRDSWNVLDFIIVISSYPSLFTDSSASDSANTDFSLGSLRTFRVLRPLKTISNIRGLKVLMSALFSAMPLLKDTLIILQFFFIMFAITGT